MASAWPSATWRLRTSRSRSPSLRPSCGDQIEVSMVCGARKLTCERLRPRVMGSPSVPACRPCARSPGVCATCTARCVVQTSCAVGFLLRWLSHSCRGDAVIAAGSVCDGRRYRLCGLLQSTMRQGGIPLSARGTPALCRSARLMLRYCSQGCISAIAAERVILPAQMLLPGG